MQILVWAVCVVALLYGLLLVWYRNIFTHIPVVGLPPPAWVPITSLTIIIPARNEATNIEQCLQSILQNNYPTHLLQIIVVDDNSTDNTAVLVQKYAAQHVQLLSLNDWVCEPINSYKKKAIELAVAHARGTLIITTDADCIVPTTWLHSLAHAYELHKPAFIAAPVVISPLQNKGSKFSFIQLFQCVDFMTLQGVTAAVVSKNKMTMCNGANMAYEKAAYDKVGGFAGIDDIASGDDMLLMHKIYTLYPGRILFLKSALAIVHTAPVHTLAQFINQRIRWASKADKYNDKRILPILLLVYFFNLSLLIMPVVGLLYRLPLYILDCNLSLGVIWLGLLGYKIIVELFFLYPVSVFFNKQKLLWYFPLLQIFHIAYTVVAGWLGKFGSYTWKMRRVK